MPLCRSLGAGLWEVRTSLSNKAIARVLVCFHDGRLYALHAFIKKTQKAPTSALQIARKHMKDVENG